MRLASARQEVLKQQGWGTQRVWWAPILTRGKLHVVVFDENFPGEEPQGVAKLLPKLLAAVNVRFPNAARKGGIERTPMNITMKTCLTPAHYM